MTVKLTPIHSASSRVYTKASTDSSQTLVSLTSQSYISPNSALLATSTLLSSTFLKPKLTAIPILPPEPVQRFSSPHPPSQGLHAYPKQSSTHPGTDPGGRFPNSTTHTPSQDNNTYGQPQVDPHMIKELCTVSGGKQPDKVPGPLYLQSRPDETRAAGAGSIH